MNLARLITVLLLASAVAAGAGLLLQRQEASALQTQLAGLREEHAEIARLQTENRRLAAMLPGERELAALRADHAALGRLRSEVDRLKESVQARERALTEAAR